MPTVEVATCLFLAEQIFNAKLRHTFVEWDVDNLGLSYSNN